MAPENDRAARDALSSEIWFERPDALAEILPYHVRAAGRTVARAGMPLVRQRFNQHVLIAALAGVGLIRLGDRDFRVPPGTLAWLDTSRQYAQGCAAGTPSWHYLWLGVQGYGLDALFSRLRLDMDPLVGAVAIEALTPEIRAVIGRLRSPGPASAPANSAAVARVLAMVIAARGPSAPEAGPHDHAMLALADQMRAGLARAWSIADLATLAGLSPAQLHRRFLQAQGATPMAWLRRERIHAAKGRLVGSTAKISAVAAACGYDDPYHFSRDFARLTGQPPSAFRRSGGW